jgi:hypothetical protein
VVVKYKVRLSNVDGVELFFIYLFIYSFEPLKLRLVVITVSQLGRLLLFSY